MACYSGQETYTSEISEILPVTFNNHIVLYYQLVGGFMLTLFCFIN